MRVSWDICAGALPASLANVESMVALDVSDNQLGGTLSDFAFQAAANRADLHSALRYFDIANNSFAGTCSHCLKWRSHCCADWV